MSTPHPSATPHLDVETLAELQEGLLDAERATAVAAHLQGCDRCRATRDALDEVRGLLRDQATVDLGAAPDDVVRRLDDALAAAATPAATAAATVIPLTTPRRSPWRTRGLQAAAVFVLVAALGGLGYGGIRALHTGSSDVNTAASSGGAKALPEKGLATGSYRITSSGRDYTDASLRAAVPALLAGSLRAPVAGPQTTAAPSPSPSASSPSAPLSAAAPADPQRLRDGTALAACVANLAGGPVTPLAVDLGRFEGKPATIIVLPDPDDRSFVDAYAVKPDCATGTFLTYQRVALP
jgi:hypothetical protein